MKSHARALRRSTLALGTSALAWGLALPNAAQAQCVPDPTVTNGTSTCTGTDTNGIRVTTAGTTLTVASGATVTNSGAPAVTVDVPKAAYTSVTDRITVLGQVLGGTQSGIVVYTGGPATAYNSTQVLALTVGAGATVSGSTALSLLNTAGSYQALVASIDNAGTLTGTGGTALSGNATTSSGGTAVSIGGFTSITNRPTGSIVGGIIGPVGTLTNAGTINGGAGSAIDASVTPASGSGNSPTPGAWTNTGTIRSSSTAATILVGNTSGFGFTITNSGAIQNTGTGAAINSGAIPITITNAAGGQIGSAGATAITGTGAISLSNQGVITGNIVTGAGSSTIDSSQGTINGSVTFGAGNDTLIARYAGSRTLSTGITGTINGGGGSNTEQVVFATDTSVTTPIDLATNFQQLGLAPANGVTATLQQGFQTAAPVLLSGSGGSVINRGTIAVAGQTAVTTATTSAPSFTNAGTISMTGTSSPFAVSFGSYGTAFVNSGTISSSGGGVSTALVALNNSGTITATGTAASIGTTLTNTGTIRSTGGVGVAINGQSSYSQSTNRGMIVGATSGATVSTGQLVNDGVVTGGATGVALGYSGTLINDAGGVVTGGTTGVTNTASTVAVLNAGTINGAVNLASTLTYDSSNDIFVDIGGTVNGAIRLGGGDDLLVVDLANASGRPLAGAAGGVDPGAGYDTIRYRVGAAASANLALVSGFEGLGYELSNNAALTLTAAQSLTTTIGLAGNGSVTLNGSISTTDRTLIDGTVLTTDQLTGLGAGPARNLSITNNGSLAVATTSQSIYTSLLGAVNVGTGSFTNNGTITTTSTVANAYGFSAVFGGTSVTNAGTIAVTRATGISGATAIVNTGTITDTAGSGGAGVAGFTTLINSGTIRVDGLAVSPGSSSATITNSGTIESRTTAAVALGQSILLTNAAGGTVKGPIVAVSMSGGAVVNRGSIIGNVASASTSFGANVYFADGGTVTGNVTFGSGLDVFVQSGTGATGVSGVIDGGAGTQDVFGYTLTSSDTVSLDPRAKVINFENALVQARGSDTITTLTASAPFTGLVYLGGDGTIVNRATLTGGVLTALPSSLGGVLPGYSQTLATLDNEGTISGTIHGSITTIVNNGVIGSKTQAADALSIVNAGALTVTNAGQIVAQPTSYYLAANLSGTGAVAVNNSGAISGTVYVRNTFAAVDPGSLAVTNSGTIISDTGTGLSVAGGPNTFPNTIGAGGAISIANSGTLAATAGTGTVANGLLLEDDAGSLGLTFTIANSGTIGASAQAGGTRATSAYGLEIFGGTALVGSIYNASGGVISAAADRAYSLLIADAALNLVNAGTITANGRLTSVAIQTFDSFNNRVVSTGSISGNVSLAAGADTVDNAGTINGAVSLGAGDDTFIQRVGGTASGLIDGGDGTDSYVVNTTGGTTALAAGQIANFERVTQTGTGTGVYSGTFGVDTIGLAGGTLSVAAGQTLATAGATTVTGIAGSGNLAIVNAGTIAGGITLADGNDTVVNTGTIRGGVQFGAGDDTYIEGVGSIAQGGVDGGAGTNLYRVVLAGDRTGIGARSNFQNLAVEGTGTLALTLDQGFQTIALNGTNLSLALAGKAVGLIDARGGAGSVSVDGDVGAVLMGPGNDTLALGAATLAGQYDGGPGANLLRLTNAGAVTLTGAATSFQTVALNGNALTIAGTLGGAGSSIAFVGSDKVVTVASGGVLAGAIDLGAGNDSFRLAAGGTLIGTVSGGAGSNAATLELTQGDLTLRAGTLTNFQQLATMGAGTLTLSGGAFAYDQLAAAGGLTVAVDASLAGRIVFGPADNRLVIAGGFSGSVDGAAGTDTIDVSGGSAAAPVAFSSVSNIEAYRMSGGLATVSGTAALGSVALTGGRLIGLAGSTLNASTFTVGQNAIFGSAGTVNGNVAVAGILSPGASPGTMTVNGNVALGATSISYFELTPTVSDKLVVNGAVSIASGATLQLAPVGTIVPGTVLDLVTATGGITGAYTTIVKPASLFGYVAQDGTRIQFLGLFRPDATLTAQQARTATYLNAVLANGQASAALIAAVPTIATTTNAADPASLSRLSPEPYAAARQIATENGLTLADTARGAAFAPNRDTPGLFIFASALGSTRTLEANDVRGTARATTNGYGFLGGIGIAGTGWSVGAFGGYLNDRQTLAGLGARTTADGAVAGVHGRARYRGIGLRATVAYDGAHTDTRRVLPGGSADGRYDLTSWIADAAVDVNVPLAGGWNMRPSVGGTAIRTTRDGVTETGGNAFALTVAGRRTTATFVDGGATFARNVTSGAMAGVHPYLTIGVRYQAQGRTPYALAGLGGGGLGLLAAGAPRAPVLATATLGADVALSPRLALFGALSGESGDADHRAAARGGIRLAF